VPSTKAEDALHPILDWISQFGCPSEIVSDNGTQYVNKLIEQFTQAAGIEHATIHAYSHEENALAQRILNTMTHTSIGVSPSQMLYGGIINHDTHFLNPYIKSEPKSHKEHITKLLLPNQLIRSSRIRNTSAV
jgi:ABC-type proline/glycine betaine transport system ATPase subunit